MALDSELLALLAWAGVELDLDQLEETAVWMRQRVGLHRLRCHVEKRVQDGEPLSELLAVVDRRLVEHQAARPWRRAG